MDKLILIHILPECFINGMFTEICINLSMNSYMTICSLVYWLLRPFTTLPNFCYTFLIGVATPIQQRTDGVGEVSAAPFESPGSFHTSAFGAQPDDRPSKPIEGNFFFV